MAQKNEHKFIHSGSSLLNLALTGSVTGGWPLGRVSNLIGDKSSGKTLFAIEASTMFMNNPPEEIIPRVHYLELEAAFDQDYAESLGMPVDKIDFVELPDPTIENVFFAIERVCDNHKKGEGHLFIIDSLDAVDSEDDLKRDFDDNKTYGMQKQKLLSSLFKKLTRRMEQAKMHLMVISQIRENISTIPFAPKYRRSGGKALDFYATHIIWLAETEKLKTSTKMIYGTNCHVKVTKNKIGKNYREVDFPIIYSFGIDEIYSLIKFLSSEKVPTEFRIKKQTGGNYVWRGITDKINELVSVIEAEPDLYTKLVDQTQQAWDAIEDEATVARMAKADIIKAHRENLQKPALPKIEFNRRQVHADDIVEGGQDD
jgi:RecA/RadA recombinase